MKDSKGHTTQSPLLTKILACQVHPHLFCVTNVELEERGQVLAQAGGAGGLLARRAAKRQHQVDRARERNQLIRGAAETSLIN